MKPDKFTRKENGKVMITETNIAKMSVWEYWKHVRGWKNVVFPILTPDLKGLVINILHVISYILQLTPVALVYWYYMYRCAKNNIEEAKRWVAIWEPREQTKKEGKCDI